MVIFELNFKKMKYYSFLILVLAVLNAKGQDSTKHVSKHSISFTCGTNIVYPNTHQFSSVEEGGFNPFWDGGAVWNYKITPVTSVNPWITLNYNYLLHQYAHFSFALDFGASYLQYTYKMNATGRYQSLEINDTGIYTAEARASVFELNLGISANYRIVNKLTWHNTITLTEGLYSRSFPIFSTNAPSSAPFYETTQYINTNASTYAYIYYETGFDFQVCDKLSIMPTIEIPVFNVGFLFENTGPVVTLPTFPYPQTGAPSPIYHSLRTGIMVTYNL
jgi:hypothetical protein